MKWLTNLFRRAEPAPIPSPQVPSQKAAPTPEMQRTLVLTQRAWVDEQLSQRNIDDLLAINGIQAAHLRSLRSAGIETLLQANQCQNLPLMAATGDWVRDWLRRRVSTLEREYLKHRKELESESLAS
jgi:predicted flap endonuclease-1-like 5' DNA nuclease